MLSLGNNITSSSAIESKYSLNLDGTDDHLDCGIVDFDTNNFSISLWFKVADGVTWDQYAALLDNKNTAGDGLGCVLWFNGTGEVRFFSVFGSGLDLAESHVTGLAVDTWHHIAVTVNRSGNQVLYANGSAANTDNISSFSSADITNSLNLLIGKYRGSGGKYVEGKIDEVAIWNVELDSDAVSAIYNSGRPFNLNFDRGNYDNSSNLQQYWKMGDGPNDDKADGIVHDAHDPGFDANLAEGDNATMGSSSNWTGSGATVTDGYDSGDANHATVLRIEADNATSSRAELDQSNLRTTTVAGKIHLVEFDFKWINNTNVNKAYVQVGNTLDNDGYAINNDGADSTGWSHYKKYIIPADNSTRIRLYVNDSGHVDNEVLIDNFIIKPLKGHPGITSGNPTFSSDAP